MPFNLSGALVPFHLLIKPRLVQPFLVVKDIRHLDFQAFFNAGYRAAVFDKDNCLTLPHVDTLVPELKESWTECKTVFGKENVLIVSNSAGAVSDAGDIKAESVSHSLEAPILRHGTLKPSYRCISSIRAYFSSLPQPVTDGELLVIGDRIFTDVVLANRMQSRTRSTEHTSEKINGVGHPQGPLPILVENLWKRDSTVPRFLEKAALKLVNRWAPVSKTDDQETLLKSFVRSNVSSN
ncbi:HAD-superfamily phosphatase [Schizopora paradoxa]|uniref:HAD-superfamily phosphatase n=1 Tax=Schizopora paradoxa TaxID=27342 RepID=A0A0H2S6X8_9AGAM|nr:HAD-superfamily phosphatase [Schizopora paradoxa]